MEEGIYRGTRLERSYLLTYIYIYIVVRGNRGVNLEPTYEPRFARILAVIVAIYESREGGREARFYHLHRN